MGNRKKILVEITPENISCLIEDTEEFQEEKKIEIKDNMEIFSIIVDEDEIDNKLKELKFDILYEYENRIKNFSEEISKNSELFAILSDYENNIVEISKIQNDLLKIIKDIKNKKYDENFILLKDKISTYKDKILCVEPENKNLTEKILNIQKKKEDLKKILKNLHQNNLEPIDSDIFNII